MPTDDRKVNELLDAYLDHLRVERGLARNTLEAYSRDLAEFIHWVDETLGKPVRDLRDEDLRFYFLGMGQAGMSARSVRRKTSSLRGLFRYLQKEGYMVEDPTELIEVPRLGTPLPKDLTMDEVDRLLAQPDPAEPLGIRNQAMLELLYATGLRVSELLALRLQDLNLEVGYVVAYGKGKKERLVPVGEVALEKTQGIPERCPARAGQDREGPTRVPESVREGADPAGVLETPQPVRAPGGHLVSRHAPRNASFFCHAPAGAGG